MDNKAPKKPQNRTEMLVFRVTAAEKKIIEDAAMRKEVRLSNFIRLSVLGMALSK